MNLVPGRRPLRAIRSACSLLALALCIPASTLAQTALDVEPDVLTPEAIATAEWLATVQQEIVESEYELSWQTTTPIVGVGAAWQAPNRAQNLRTFFLDNGIQVCQRDAEPISWTWSPRLTGFGRAGQSWPVSSPVLTVLENRAEYDRGGIVEWYVNLAAGLEQGFKIILTPEESAGEAEPLPFRALLGDGGTHDPSNDTAGWLHLDLAVDSILRPVVSADRQAVDFLPADGTPGLHYAKLHVTDAQNQILPSWIEEYPYKNGAGIRLVFDATNAVYPLTVDPLSTTSSWAGEGEQAGASYGLSVATAGDVNGDGFSDVVVGAYAFDNGEADEGRAFVYYGSVSGLSTTAAWTAESNQAGARFGYSVATAGDVNGDGISDLIVGAYLYGNGQPREGRAFVYHGSAAGLEIAPAWTAESDQQGAQLGVSVATAGDVNGDGFSDVIVGTYSYDYAHKDEGGALVYHGSASGLETSIAWTGRGGQAHASYGYSVSTAGDVNGDGFADVIVGARFFGDDQNGEGRALVYHGSPSGVRQGASWIAYGDQDFALFGSSVSTAGDTNGDGFSDVIVGAPYYDNGEESEGRAYVFLGSSAGVAPVPAWTDEPNVLGARFGTSVAHAGDVNGDGYAEVVVGAPQLAEGRGFVYAGSGSGISLTPSWSVQGDQVGSNFGYSVSTAGDVNGDGFAEVIVGAYGFTNGQAIEGGAFTYLGSSTGLSPTAGRVNNGDQFDAGFGVSVSDAGDVNGDGFADVLIGSPLYDNGQNAEGRVFAFYGSAAGMSATPDWFVESNQGGAEMGNSVAGAGDVNGDGYDDVIVGSSKFNFESGRASVYHGSPTGLATTSDWSALGTQQSAFFGTSVAGAGDLNGDGFDDVVVGAPFFDAGFFDEGRVFVYHGSVLGLTGPVSTLDGGQQGATMGRAVATAGDVNADGFADLLIGVPGWDLVGVNEGAAYLLLGSPTSLSSVLPLAPPDCCQSNALFGSSVAPAGDVNGDGYADVLVGAPFYDDDEADEGRAYLYLGGPSGLQAIPVWTADGNQALARFGNRVATAGDVNGDGLSDFIVAAEKYDGTHTDGGAVFGYLGSKSGISQIESWAVEGPAPFSSFGSSISSAGDTNGDGYSDVIVGASSVTNLVFHDGSAFVYYGNGGLGRTVLPRQLRVDGQTPVARNGTVFDGFSVAASAFSPYGRGRVSLETEVKPVGTGFDGTGTQRTEGWLDSGTSGIEVSDLFLSQPIGRYHWRTRLVFDPVTSPFAQVSRWMTQPWNGWEESDIERSGFADLAVTQTDDTDPVGQSQFLTYSIVVVNNGPEDVDAVILNDVLPLTSTFISTTVSQGVCNPTSSTELQCNLGPLDVGQQATVQLLLGAPSVPGNYTNKATAFAGSTGDADLSNNVSIETTTVISSSIGGQVWADANENGNREAAEEPLPGILVQLFNETGQLLLSAFTGATGSYGFADLDPAAEYFIRFNAPSDRFFTVLNSGLTELTDSDADPTTGETQLFNLLTPEPSHWDAGLILTTIGNRVWEDTDGDGLQDAGEPGAPGVTVELYDGLGSLLSSTSSGAQGQYSFGGVSIGQTYFLRFIPAPDRFLTRANAGIFDDVDSDPDPTTGFTEPFVLNSGIRFVWDAGITDAGIGDRVWADQNGNGLQDPGEPGEPNVIVALSNGSGAILATTVTDFQGFYRFGGVLTGNLYRLRFIPQASQFLTIADAGTDDALDSDADSFTGETPLFVLGATGTTIWDAGVTDCVGPDEPIFISGFRESTDGNNYTIVDFEDPNQPSQVTGYNVYRSSVASLPQEQWELVATDVVDADAATPNNQWIDISDDVSPTGVWFYEIAAFNSECGLEGPR